MLDSLLVKNYRLFEHLEVDSLKRINLIVGKNNVGKTALLEALAVYFNGGLQGVVRDIVRDQYYFHEEGMGNEVIEDFVRNGELSLEGKEGISIGSKYDELNKLNITFIEQDFGSYFPELIIRNNYKGVVDESNSGSLLSLNKSKPKNIFGLLATKNVDKNWLAELWNKVALTDEESYIVEGLQILDNRINRISFIEENKEKVAIVRLSGKDNPVKLSTMGDGMNHILAMMIHLVNCKDGYFLVDEFETGLHWSVQKDLWKIIIHLAEKLNVQVFATTHSRDAIWALEEVAKEQKYNDAQLVKLFRNKKDVLKAKTFDTNHIETALEQNIELR